MASAEAKRVLAELMAEKGNPRPPLEQSRREWLEKAGQDEIPQGTEITETFFAGIRCEWVKHKLSAGQRVFVFIHGGGFCAGAPATHRKLAAHISRATGTRVLLPDYRLAPEHPFPSGVQDCLAVYGGLLKAGVRSYEIAIGGDSAGGGMTVSTLIALRDGKAPLPTSATLIAPWLDLTNSSPTYTTNAATDPTISLPEHNITAGWYAGHLDRDNPLISPLFAELKGLPPILVQAGGIETMLDDSRLFAERAQAAGVDATLQVWPGLWHVWHQWVPEVPEALEAIEKIGTFTRTHLHR